MQVGEQLHAPTDFIPSINRIIGQGCLEPVCTFWRRMKPAVKLVENEKMPKTYLDKQGAVMMRQLLRLDCLA
jgi:hypothetical protein